MASWQFGLTSTWLHSRVNHTCLQEGLAAAKIKVASITCLEAAIDTQRVRVSARGLVS